jgi:hypothetical protein
MRTNCVSVYSSRRNNNTSFIFLEGKKGRNGGAFICLH